MYDLHKPGTPMNGHSGSEPSHLFSAILKAIGRLEGGQEILINQFAEHRTELSTVAKDVAVLKAKADTDPSKSKADPLWRQLPVKEVSLLLVLGLSGLLQILQPAEVKSAAKALILQVTGAKK